MKRIFLTTLLSAILIFFGSTETSWSQVQDTIGVVDTVKVEKVVTYPGAKVVVSVYEFNDEEIGALTLPLRYLSQYLVCDSVSFIGSRVEYINIKPVAIDTIQGTVKIGAISVLEPPLSPGRGKLADLFFRVKANAPSQVMEIDTFSVVEPSFTLSVVYTFTSGPDSGMSVDLIPAFEPGFINVVDENLPPEIDPISSQYVNEGDSLIINVHAQDPEQGTLNLGVLSSPPTASFEDFGDGSARFIWVPDFYGPWSSTNSPFSVTFLATDGTNSAYQGVEINVINSNAPPALNLPGDKVIPVGMLLSFSVSALDPDKEPVSIALLDQPPGSNFDGKNPGIFSWVPEEKDTGEYFLKFYAEDSNGGKSSGEVRIMVSSILGYTLNLGNVVGNLGGVVGLPVYLSNPDFISGMDLLIEFETTALNFIEVSKSDTRIESWESFNYLASSTDSGQQVRIIGIADIQMGLVTPPLGPGTGVVCYLKFMATTDLKYDGISIPVKFRFINSTNNTFSDPEGGFIAQEEITYNDGGILLQKPQNILLGDLNLNQTPFEIGDIVRFANYFVNPVLNGFDIEQMFNSDVNEDGIQATIADFISMIRYMLSGGGSVGKSLSSGEEVEIDVVDEPSNLILYMNSEIEVGGILIELRSDRVDLNSIKLSSEIDSMSSRINKEGDVIRVVIYSDNGSCLKPGLKKLLTILKEKEDESIELENIQLCDTKGELLKVDITYEKEKERPSDFSLSQNYPNPFNPETYIDFTLPHEAEVSLMIYNVKGQVVKTLIQGRMSAGAHTVRWNGRNNTGERVSSGVYFYKFKSEEVSFVKKMVVLK
ncbi:MAG: FlgD immunoglobulin-like domain containing protein [Candidatus Zixiibacteriota bacterium]